MIHMIYYIHSRTSFLCYVLHKTICAYSIINRHIRIYHYSLVTRLENALLSYFSWHSRTSLVPCRYRAVPWQPRCVTAITGVFNRLNSYSSLTVYLSCLYSVYTVYIHCKDIWYTAYICLSRYILAVSWCRITRFCRGKLCRTRWTINRHDPAKGPCVSECFSLYG